MPQSRAAQMTAKIIIMIIRTQTEITMVNCTALVESTCYLVDVGQAAAPGVTGDATSWEAGGDVGHLRVDPVSQVQPAEVRWELKAEQKERGVNT